jgi:glycosyltransferase involved in cell wall biosynthesis
MTLVSVLMPIKGDCPYLSYAVQSVRLQSLTDWELVICKDQIDKASGAYLREMSVLDPRIRLVDTFGLALPAALNRGLEECKGEFIARFDADDVMLPGRLRNQMTFLQNGSDYVACGGQIVIIDEGNKLSPEAPFYNLKNRTLKSKLDFKCPFPHPGAMIRTRALREIGGYSPNYKFAEDYELWLRLSHLGKFANLKSSVIAYRNYTSQTSARFRAETRLSMAVALVREFNREHPDQRAIEKVDADLFRTEYSLLDESKKRVVNRLYRKDPFLTEESNTASHRNNGSTMFHNVLFFLSAVPRRSIHLILTFLNSFYSFLKIRPLWNGYLSNLRSDVITPPTKAYLEK